jgi:hypothetical protein
MYPARRADLTARLLALYGGARALLWNLESTRGGRFDSRHFQLVLPAGAAVRDASAVHVAVMWTVEGDGRHFDAVDIEPGSPAADVREAQMATYIAEHGPGG